MVNRSTLFTLVVCVVIWSGQAKAEDARPPFMASGIKICEVTATSAIIWTRLTREPSRASEVNPVPDVLYTNPETGGLVPRKGSPSWKPTIYWPPGYDINNIKGAVPGTAGDVRISYRPDGSDGEWTKTSWQSVQEDRDFTRQVKIDRLKPGTTYALRVESRKGMSPGQMREGGFGTAAAAEKASKVVFTVVTGQGNNGQESDRGFKIYPQMQKLNPDFFVNTGDILYYDSLAKTLPLARWHWQRVFSFRNHVRFHEVVPSYFIKDDHDTWMNDSYPGQDTQFMGAFTFDQGKAVFLEQVGMGERTYRTVRWGKDLQVWMVEGRD
jgi:alkaline phosphatase D